MDIAEVDRVYAKTRGKLRNFKESPLAEASSKMSQTPNDSFSVGRL
jgi:hypothetical protein